MIFSPVPGSIAAFSARDCIGEAGIGKVETLSGRGFPGVWPRRNWQCREGKPVRLNAFSAAGMRTTNWLFTKPGEDRMPVALPRA